MNLLKVFVLSVTALTLVSATPPPGYVKKPDNDKDPPKYEYGYDVADGVGGRQGHLESRDGIYAHGMYYVTVPGSGQKVQYFADDWGYHPLVSYSTNTKGSSSTAQFAFGEKAVHALHQSGGAASVSSSIDAKFSSRAPKAQTLITPVSNHLRQGGPVSTSSYSLNNGQGALVINHGANNVGISSGSAQSYQEGGQINYQQNVLTNQAFQTTVTPQPPLQLRQQQRLTATLQVGPNVPQAESISGNSVGTVSVGDVGSAYLVQGSAAQTAVGGSAINAGNQGHQQYLVEVNADGGSFQAQSGAAEQLIGTHQLALQQPQQYSQTLAGESVSHGEGSTSTSTSYSSQTSGQLEYGAKLSSLLRTGSNGFASSYGQSLNGNEINREEQVVAVTAAPLPHTSLQPIVVAEYQNQEQAQVATPTPPCNCPSSTPASFIINANGASSSYQASTSGLLSISSESSVSNLGTNVLDSHVTTQRPIVVQSTTSVPPFFISDALSSSAHASTGSASSLLASNNGDSGHIDVAPYSSTPQPPLLSSTPYVSSHSTQSGGFLVNSLPLPVPTSHTVVITPKPQPIAEALTSSHEILAPFQAAYSLAEYAGSSDNIQSDEEQQTLTKLSLVQPDFKENVRFKTVVEIQKAIPIEVSQESLNAEDEARILENGIPISYIQHIVNSAEQNGHSHHQLLNNQAEYGYKLNTLTNVEQSDNNQVQVQLQHSTGVASQGQIQAQLAGQAEEAAEANNKQKEITNEGQSQESLGQQQIVVNEPQQFIGPLVGPPKTIVDNKLHEATHQYHKEIVNQIQHPHSHYIRHPYRVTRPQPHFNFQVLQEIHPVRPIRYGQKIRQRGHRFNSQFFRNQQNKAQLELNHEFLTQNRNLLQTEEARKQAQINQASLQANEQLYNVEHQFNQISNAGVQCDHSLHTEVVQPEQTILTQQSINEDQQLHAAGHQLNQQILQQEVNKIEDQRAQDLVGATQQLVSVVNNQQSELQQQLEQNVASIINTNNQQFGVQQDYNLNFANFASNQQSGQQEQQYNQNIANGFTNSQIGPQQQFNQNVGGVVSNQQSIRPNQNVVSKINNQQTVLQQQYNQQLLANTVRKPSSSALAQQAVNTNHQLKLKFVRQPEGEKQAEVEKDYNQQLVEESKQDHIQSEKQVNIQEQPLKLLLDAERQVSLKQEGQSFDGLNQHLQDVQVGFLDSHPEALPLQQVGPVDSGIQAPLLQSISLQESLPLQQSILNQQTTYLNSLSLQQQFPIEHTKVFPVEHTKYVEVTNPGPISRPVNIEHTKIIEVKKPYPVPYPVRVEHTRVVNIDRPYPVPHPVPIEVTKLVAVDRPWPYPQPYPVPHPVPVPYAVPHPVQVPVNHYIHYPHVIRVPVKDHQQSFFNGNHGPVHRPPMPRNPHFQKEAAHAYFKSHYGFGGGNHNHNIRPQFSYKSKFFVGPTNQFKSGRSLSHAQQQQLLSRHRPKALNIEYGFKPPLIPSQQIPVDPEPEPFTD